MSQIVRSAITSVFLAIPGSNLVGRYSLTPYTSLLKFISIPFIVSFVRSTLSALNTKMDNLLSNQAAFESKLEAIEHRVTINTTVTTELSRATEFNANTIKDQQTVIDSLQKSLAALAQHNVSMSSSLNTLNAKISRSERHSRSFNVRCLGVPEQDGEN